MLLVEFSFWLNTPTYTESFVGSYLIADDLDEAFEEYKESADFSDIKSFEISSSHNRFSLDNSLPDWKERAASYGLTIEENGETILVSGPEGDVIKWYRGDDWELEDIRKGDRRYYWRFSREISEEETAVLVKLGVAKDIRYSNSGSDMEKEIGDWLKSICNTTEGDEYLFCGDEDYFYFRVKKRKDSSYTILWGFSNWPRPLKTKAEIKSALIALGAVRE